MTEDTAQSNPVSSLGKVRTPRSLPGAGGASSPSEPNPPHAARPAAPSLAEARALVSSPLWPRIRAFLWDFASLCDPARLAAAAASPPFEGAVGAVGKPPSAALEGSLRSPSEGGSAAVHGESQTPAKPASNVREADLERGRSPLGTGGAAALANALATTPRVAASALRALGVSPFFHSFPATGFSRLLLLSREDYDRLAQFLGTVALAPALRRVTAGAEVRALKAALSDYRETLAYAAYFHRFEALFKRFEAADPPTDPAADNSAFSIQHSALPAAVLAAGHRLLAASLSDLPPELLLRQRLRFPAGSPADAALGAVSEGAFGAVGKPPSAALEDSLRSPSEGGSAAVQVKSGTSAKPASNAREADFERGRSPLGTTGKAGLGTAEAAAALAAARLALKLSNPTEYSTLCS